MKLEGKHLEKLSGFSMDISKMLIGATFVSIFVPDFTGGVNISIFVSGIIAAIVLTLISLKLIPINQTK